MCALQGGNRGNLAVMRSADTFTALNRFGLGAAPGEAAYVGNDPRGWVAEQIRPEAALPPLLAGFRSSEAVITAVNEARLVGNQARNRVFRATVDTDSRAAVLARAEHMMTTSAPLFERMVQFWSNHFTVSAQRRQIVPFIPGYEREAIRPHVFGRFADLLRAVVRHPVMLMYLDSPRSVGPESPDGRRNPGREGINENLAREVLELHTLGVNGGYTQADVTQFAMALTGWSHGGLRRGGAEEVHGRFVFVRRHHQPADKIVMGRVYPEDGQTESEGLAILDDLASDQATARHIATKLVRHFIADEPPAALVAALARVFQRTDGDLAEVMRALVAMGPAWADPLAKVKSHHDFIIAVHRAAGQGMLAPPVYFGALRLLAAEPFNALSPAGFGDTAAHWLGPESLMIRVEWARQFAARLPGGLVPRQVMEDSIGAVARPVTQTWVHRAPSGDAALAMLFASPEFQRR